VTAKTHLIIPFFVESIVSPLPEKDRVLIGATHEFKKDPLTENEVEVELRERSYEFASSIWDKGSIDDITIGYRVQSN
jgi:hypothetical protein